MSSQQGHGVAGSGSGAGAGAGAAAAGGDAEGGGGGGAASSASSPASSSLSSSSSTAVDEAPAPPARPPATTGPSEERFSTSEKVEDLIPPRLLDAWAERTPNLDDGEELASSDETSCSSSSSGDSECEVTGQIICRNGRTVQLIISKEPRRLRILDEKKKYDSCERPYRWTGRRKATFTAYPEKGRSSKAVTIKLSAADMRKIDELKGSAARLG